jgi:hypothetical protein
MQYYIFSIDVSIDEFIIKYYKRSQHTYKIFNKPIFQNYKLFILVDHGYIFYFIKFSRKYEIGEFIKDSNCYGNGS